MQNGWTDRYIVCYMDAGGPKEPCIRLRSRSPHVKRQFWGGKGAGPGHARRSTYSKWLSRGQHWHGADAHWYVLDGLHIGWTWRIQLNRPCAAAMQPYVKLSWPLVQEWNWQTPGEYCNEVPPPAKCHPGWKPSLHFHSQRCSCATSNSVDQASYSPVYTIQPVVKPVVSCKRGYISVAQTSFAQLVCRPNLCTPIRSHAEKLKIR